MDTNYNTNVAGALKLITINGSTYQLGKDAGNDVGGIAKLFGGTGAFESKKASTDGAYDAKTVYDAITAVNGSASDLEDALGEGFSSSNTVADAVAAAKTGVAQASSDYITVTKTTDSTDGHDIYTIGTTGIDTAISDAVASIVDGADAAFDTLKEIADWIQADQTGAAAILADVANKANKVAMSGNGAATQGNFFSISATGDLADSGYNASSFQAAGNYKTTQTAVSDPSADGNGVTFIDSISQNTNGVITPHKKTVQSASASQAGLMSAADYSKLAAVSASVSGDTLSITTTASA